MLKQNVISLFPTKLKNPIALSGSYILVARHISASVSSMRSKQAVYVSYFVGSVAVNHDDDVAFCFHHASS